MVAQEDLHAEDTSTSCPIPCPVCRNGHLTEHNGVVLCSSGDLRMDLRVEGLTLDDVRWRSLLASADSIWRRFPSCLSLSYSHTFFVAEE